MLTKLTFPNAQGRESTRDFTAEAKSQSLRRKVQTEAKSALPFVELPVFLEGDQLLAVFIPKSERNCSQAFQQADPSN